MSSISQSISKSDIQRVEDLYERGLYLQAYATASEWGALTEWPGVDAGILACRLAAQLGADGLSNWILRRLRKTDADHPEVRYFSAYSLLRRRGPYAAWCSIRSNAELDSRAEVDVLSSWHALRGETAALLRDFETAEACLQLAEKTDPANPWVQVAWSFVWERMDRYDDALAAANRALELRPMYRAGVQAVGHALSLRGRDAEALALYAQAMQQIESAAVAGAYYALQMELSDYANARETLERFTALSPLADRRHRLWYAAQQSEIVYHCGDIQAAIRWAGECGQPFFEGIAKNLQDPQRAAAKRVLLNVPFVRQHQLTCAPATLSAISRYWNEPAEHLQVADQICYDGTTAYNERKWARENGWLAREFTVTEQSAQQLLDRGVPFTFTTIDPGNAHLQAIIGYDGRRGTLLIRDPFWRNLGESLASGMLERYAPFGPRGMAMVPISQAALLADLDLPDAALWDALHDLDGAILDHRRPEAQEIYERMMLLAPDHRLIHGARRRLAYYDGNASERLAAVDQLLLQFPTDACLEWERLALSRFQVSRDERLLQHDKLRKKKETHPIYWQQYAQELQQDARRHAEAIELLLKTIGRWPSDAAAYGILGNIYWQQRRWDDALDLYRIAACLADKDPQCAQVYFRAATWRKQTNVLLELLRARFQRDGQKSSQPARTLASALMQLNRETEALAVFEQAIQLRPTDGPLLLDAADTYVSASTENLPRSMDLLEQAQDKCPRPDWLRTAARIYAAAGSLSDALALWQSVLELQPLAVDAHQSVTRLLAETRGTAAALDHLAAAAARFPHHHPLHELWVEWLRDEPIEQREPVIRQVVTMVPDDAWIHRELADTLADAHRYDDAWPHLETAGKLEPFNPSYPLLQAKVLRGLDRCEEAKAALREAIRLSVDCEMAIAQWMDLCTTLSERRAALAFVRDELVKQVTTGDGLLAYREYARGAFPADELLALLEAGRSERPDLWHAWSAVMLQLLEMDRVDDAWDIGQQATQRFPLLPRLWLDLARICRARSDGDGEQAALASGLRINPGRSPAAIAMCEFLGRRCAFRDAQRIAQQAVQQSPLDPANHTLLAEQCWELGERDQALEHVQRAIQIGPGYERAWNALDAWCAELGRPQVPVQTARDLTERRGGEARSWLALARVLDSPEQSAERHAALDQAIARNARCLDAHDQRAQAFAQAGKYEEALAACCPQEFNGQIPPQLSVRAALIEAERGQLPRAIEQMRAVLVEDPHYYFGWMRLADWQRELGNKAEHLSAAQELVRISPQYEVSLGYLGDALLDGGDRDGARTAYSRALERNPAYEYVGNNLFDMQLADGDLNGAATTMAVLRARTPTAYAMARAVQLGIRRNDNDLTLTSLRSLCVMRYEGTWPLMNCVTELQGTPLAADARRVMRQALAQPDVHPHVGRALIELVIHDAQTSGSDVRGVLLAQERELTHDKAYLSAWARLADWHRDAQDTAGYLRCAKALRRCDSDNVISYGYLGEALLCSGEPEEAKAAFVRAIEIDPRYDFAGSGLFDIYLESHNIDAARRLVEQRKAHHTSPFLVNCEVRLAAATKDAALARESLTQLCTLIADNAGPLTGAVEALKASRMEGIAEEALQAALKMPNLKPAVATQWVVFAKQRKPREVAALLQSLLEHPQAGKYALNAYLEAIGSKNRDELRRFIANERTWLQASLIGWSSVGWALAYLCDYHELCRWCAHWRERAGVEPWMLINAVEGFRACGKTAEARACSNFALTLPRQPVSQMHEVWLALDEAAAGNFDAAAELLRGVDSRSLDSASNYLYVLVSSAVELAEAPALNRPHVFAQIRRRLNQLQEDLVESGAWTREPARRAAFFAIAARVAALGECFAAFRWGWWWRAKRWNRS